MFVVLAALILLQGLQGCHWTCRAIKSLRQKKFTFLPNRQRRKRSPKANWKTFHRRYHSSCCKIRLFLRLWTMNCYSTFFWGMASCSSVHRYQLFGESFCLFLQFRGVTHLGIPVSIDLLITVFRTLPSHIELSLSSCSDQSLAMKMQEAVLCENLVPIYETTWHHTYCHENFQSCINSWASGRQFS